MPRDLFQDAETLQGVCVSRAVGGTPSEEDYRELRTAILADPSAAAKAPRFIRTCRDLDQFWAYIKRQSGQYQPRREHIWDEFADLLAHLEAAAATPAVAQAGSVLSVADSPHVQAAWSMACARKGTDPDGAITSARTLLESVCKHVLDKAAVAYEESWDLPRLYKTAAERLNLAPQQHTENVFKKILGGCHTVVEGLGELRNKLGDAHGKGKAQVRPSTRHAALAVNLAGSVAAFLIATLEEKGTK